MTLDNIREITRLATKLNRVSGYDEWNDTVTRLSNLLACGKEEATFAGVYDSYTYMVMEWKHLADTIGGTFCEGEFERYSTVGWSSSWEKRKIYAEGINKLASTWKTLTQQQGHKIEEIGANHKALTIKEINEYAAKAESRHTPVVEGGWK